MKIAKTHKLAGLLVAASLAASGSSALANDHLQADVDGNDISAVARAHGMTISKLAQELEGGPEKGAAMSAAARGHGEAVSAAARARGGENDEDADSEDTDAEESGKPADAGATGLERAAAARAAGADAATAAQTDGKTFGQAKAAAAKGNRR